MNAHRAYVGIGSNLGDRSSNVERAVKALTEFGRVTATSSLYRTEPWGRTDQPWFLNAVVALQTDRTPRRLFEALMAIERRLGRTAGRRWGPRVIDLDLLTFDDVTVDDADLTIPHPRMRERAFVLVPLAELDDRFAALRDALDESQRAGVVRYAAPHATPRYASAAGESVRPMAHDGLGPLAARIASLAQFLAATDAVRVRIANGDDEVEVVRGGTPGAASQASEGEHAETPPQRVDAIKADIVGIFRLARPAPGEGEAFEGDRELGYIEALGIRTPVLGMGTGRLLSIAARDGEPVEYGQPLFLVARG